MTTVEGDVDVKLKNFIGMVATTLAVATAFVSAPAHAGGTPTQQGQFQHGLSGKVLDSAEAAQFQFEVAHVWRALNEPMVDATTSNWWQKGKIVEIDLKNTVVTNGQEQVVSMKDVGQFLPAIQQNFKSLHDANVPVRIAIFPQYNHCGEAGPDYWPVYGAIRKIQKDLGGSSIQIGPAPNVEPPGYAPDSGQSLPKAEDVDFVGLEGANFGDRYAWSSWQSPQQVYGEMIAYLHSVYPGKPIYITHGCSVSNQADKGDQAQWVSQVVSMCQTMNVAGFTYYSEDRGVAASGKPFNWSLPVPGLTALLGPPVQTGGTNVTVNTGAQATGTGTGVANSSSSSNSSSTSNATNTTTDTNTNTATGGAANATGGSSGAAAGTGNTVNTGSGTSGNANTGSQNGSGSTPPPAQTGKP